jgi:hypothetical protein
VTTLLERLQGVTDESKKEESTLPTLEERAFEAARSLGHRKEEARVRRINRKLTGLSDWKGAPMEPYEGPAVRCGGHGGTCGKPCSYQVTDRPDLLTGYLKPVDVGQQKGVLGPPPAPLDARGAALRRASFLRDTGPMGRNAAIEQAPGRHTKTVPMCSDCRDEMRALGILR